MCVCGTYVIKRGNEGGESKLGFRPTEFAETKILFHETGAREKDVEMGWHTTIIPWKKMRTLRESLWDRATMNPQLKGVQ